MYAIRINPDGRGKPRLRAPGAVWVREGTGFYVQESERSIFKTIQEAHKAKCEKWEMIVRVE